MPGAQGHITVRRKAKDGENAVRLDLDNEHEDFIYNDVGALLSFYVTSQAHLYDGSAEVPSGNVTWSIDRSGTNGTEVENSGLPIMEDDEPNEWWSKNCCWITTGGKLYVIGINGDAYIKVKAVYKGKTYYALFYGKRISEDKYELVISRKSISFNESRAWTAQTIEFSVNRTSKEGSKQDGIALNFGNGISLSIFAKYRTSEGSEASWHKVSPNNTGRLCVLTVNNDIVRYNDEIQIELRKDMSSSVEDYETIPILKAKDGERGLEGCILRVSEWAKDVEYRNDEALTSGTRYLDIAVVTKGPNSFDAYKCKQTHTSSDSILVSNTTYWEKFNQLQPVYTPLIMAQNALLRFAQTNQLLVMKSDGETVAAGMGGGGGVQDNENYPLWVGDTTPANAPFKVRIDGKLFATGAEISGKIIASNGTIGPFTIGNGGLYCGNPEDWKTSGANFAYLHESAIRIGQHIGYSGHEIAGLKVFIGKDSDPDESDDDLVCDSAMYIYRRMNNDVLMRAAYKPAVRIISDNVGIPNVALRLDGALQAHGGVIEKGRYLYYTGVKPYDVNTFNLAHGTTYLVKCTDPPPGEENIFQLPKLSDVVIQLGLSSYVPFCIRLTIIACKGTKPFIITATSPIYNHDGNQWGSNDWGMAEGDVAIVCLCYDGSTYYIQEIDTLE